MPSSSPETTGLHQAWASLASGTDRLYARDLAANLGTTEAQLVAAGCGHDVVRLDADWAELVEALPALGPVKVITRNNAVVHEKPVLSATSTSAVAVALCTTEPLTCACSWGTGTTGLPLQPGTSTEPGGPCNSSISTGPPCTRSS